MGDLPRSGMETLFPALAGRFTEPQGKSYFCFVNKFICIIFLDPTYKWHLWYLSFSVWLASLNMIISKTIHVAVNGIISFFLWPSNIPLYIYVYIYIYIYTYIYTPHILYPFICQWTDGCFHVLAVVCNLNVTERQLWKERQIKYRNKLMLENIG